MDERNSGKSRGKVVVIGGGLAGMAAACDLADRGHPVVLMEKRPFLGGRAFSFPDPDAGREIDNGQHVFLGCCTAYVSFLEKLGVLHNTHIPPDLNVPILGYAGRKGVLRSANLPAPFHLAPSLMRYPYLSWVEKLRVLYGGLCIYLTRRQTDSGRLDRETFSAWLKRHHQTDAAIARFWNLIVLPTLNDDASEVSADMGLMVFQEGVLRSRESAGIGYAKVGLSELVSEAARDYLASRGGEAMLGAGAREIAVDGDRVCGVRTSSGTVEGDWYISALPSYDLVAMLPQSLVEGDFFSRAKGLPYSPIVDVHIWYDRPVMDEVFSGFVDSPLQWVFNKTRMQGEDESSGQYLCISLSGAWEYADTPKQEIRDMFLEEMKRLFPQAQDAQVTRLLIVKQPRATFRSIPGVGRHRLPSATPISNLFLAGEWVDTGWPGTMEGAVRSGQTAARALASREQEG